MAVGLAALVSLADEFIYLAYDARYRSAGIFLPVLLVGAWFAILASIAEAMMLGIGKSSSMAFSNGAKFVIVVATVPVLLPTAGMLAATALLLVVIVAFRELTHVIGITTGILGWIAEARDQLG